MSKSCSSRSSERESVPFLQVRAVAAVLRGDLVARLRVEPDDPRQRQQPQRVVEVDRLEGHVREQGGRARLRPRRLLGAFFFGLTLTAPSPPSPPSGRRRLDGCGRRSRGRDHLGDVRPVAAGLGDDLAAGRPGPRRGPGRRRRWRSSSSRAFAGGQLVGGDVVGNRCAAGGPRPSTRIGRPRRTGRSGRRAARGPSPSGTVEMSRASISPRLSTRPRRPFGAASARPPSSLRRSRSGAATRPAAPRRRRSGRGPPPCRR